VESVDILTQRIQFIKNLRSCWSSTKDVEVIKDNILNFLKKVLPDDELKEFQCGVKVKAGEIRLRPFNLFTAIILTGSYVQNSILLKGMQISYRGRLSYTDSKDRVFFLEQDGRFGYIPWQPVQHLNYTFRL
jgi:hypothetical protein